METGLRQLRGTWQAVKIETGEVFAYDPERCQFVPLADRPPPPIPLPARLIVGKSI